MALRSLLRKLPALGLRSPAGPLMGPVHAPSPAAAYRHMSSQARTGNVHPKLIELDQQIAQNKEAHKNMMAIIRGDLDKWNKGSMALCYPINAFSAFMVLQHLF